MYGQVGWLTLFLSFVIGIAKLARSGGSVLVRGQDSWRFPGRCGIDHDAMHWIKRTVMDIHYFEVCA